MAGKKGMKGGGGARPGAGRPKGSTNKSKSVPAAGDEKKSGGAPAPVEKDPLNFLLGVMNDATQDPRLRVRAAVAAAQYVHTKRGDGGKKDDLADKAKKAAGGRFARTAPPKLVVSNG